MLDSNNAADFLEVYRGVVPGGEFAATLKELISGDLSPPCSMGEQACS